MSPFSRRQRSRNGAIGEPSVARQVFYGVASILMVVCIVTLIWYGTRIEQFNITTVTVEGGETISHEMVRERVLGELSGSYALLIPHRFALMYPKELIRRTVENIPRIHNVAIDRVSGTEIRVTFREYLPAALWCLSLHEGSECYFMTKGGYAFAPAPELSGGSLVRYVIEGRDALKADQAIDSQLMERIESFIGRLDTDLSLRIIAIVYTADKDIQFHISGGGSVRVAGGFDAEKTLSRLQAVLSSREFKHLHPGNFDYIDLRFGNKVFIKEELRQETSVPDEVSEGDV